MLESRRYARPFAQAPQSITGLVAALLEPVLAVGVYLGACLLAGFWPQRADAVLCLLVFALTFPGRNRFQDRPLNAAVDISTSWLLLLVVLWLCGWATRSLELFDGRVLWTWAVLTPALHWAAVYGGRRWLRWLARQPSQQRAVIVIGAGPSAVRFRRALGSQGVRFLGYFDDRTDGRVSAEALPERRGGLQDVADQVREHGVHEVYITLPLSSQPRILSVLEALQDTTASVFFVPDVFGISIIQGRLIESGGVPVVALCETPFTGTNRLVKRASDIVLSTLILVVCAPLMLLLAAGVKLSSPGPVLYRQRRNGLAGEEIVIYKFRSMRWPPQGTTDEIPPAQAVRDDPRITPFGAFLRRTSLDELPQFVNVLQGRMSVVGPRPHAVAHNAQYRQLIRAYMVRHKVRPGITGWAQVNGLRGETDTLDKMQARVEHDLEYLRNWSLGWDLQIIARTVKLVFWDRHAY